MVIDAHIIAWNCEDIIRFTVAHYQGFCRDVYIYDNHSTDSTPQIAKYMGAKVSKFGNSMLDDSEYLKVKNHCWKGSDADYVIVCDIDEILHEESLLKAISENPTIVKTSGFNMYSESLPKMGWWDINTGIPDQNYSKWVCFSPKLKEINYVYGCHVAKPVGAFKLSETSVPLFHYHNIGGVERMVLRHKEYVKRLAPINLKWGLGHHYSKDENQKRKEWKDSLGRSETLFVDGIFSRFTLTLPTQNNEGQSVEGVPV